MQEAAETARTAMYSAPEVLMFITAFGVLITGAGAVIVNIIVALKTTQKVDENLKKTEGLVNQVQEVHTLTNSNLSAVKAQLDTALAQVASLTELVRELRGDRVESQIQKALEIQTPTAVIEETLQSIDKNTAEIDKNTKQNAKTK